MRLSHYLKIYPWEEDPGKRLLFSTKNASKILFSEETFRSIENGTLSGSDETMLSKLGMLVEDREEEKRDMLGFFDRMNERNAVLNLMVVLNLDCNFACVYCYEGNMKGKHYMSRETADALVRFIKENFSEQKKSLLIDFYGGEPLLSTGLIKSISKPLKAFTESRGGTYFFTLVTNGSLFNRKTAESLVPLGLNSVQITLDGPEENHNLYRPFKSGAGSFDLIIRNIQESMDLVKINIGGNYEKENYEKFVHLLNDLRMAGLTPDKISSVKFSPVMKQPDFETGPVYYKGGCLSINEPWLMEAESFLRGEILRRGYKTQKARPITCMVEIRDSCVVNFDGVLYKCPGFIGKKGFEAGNLQTGRGDYGKTYALDLWKNETCLDCSYLPLCFGGCRFMSFIRDGRIGKPDCKKDYFDASLETLIKQDIKSGPVMPYVIDRRL